MYFQKLDNLCKTSEFEDFKFIIEALDKWLYLIPRAYKDKLTPEIFSDDQQVSFDISEMIFDKLVEIGVLKENYFLKCKCGYIEKMDYDINNILEYINNHNELNEICTSCEKYEKFDLYNVGMVYELIDKPQGKNFEKKNPSTENLAKPKSNNFLKRFLKNPAQFIKDKQVDTELLQNAVPPEISDEIKYLIKD